jgi:hypothetical protein
VSVVKEMSLFGGIDKGIDRKKLVELPVVAIDLYVDLYYALSRNHCFSGKEVRLMAVSGEVPEVSASSKDLAHDISILSELGWVVAIILTRDLSGNHISVWNAIQDIRSQLRSTHVIAFGEVDERAVLTELEKFYSTVATTADMSDILESVTEVIFELQLSHQVFSSCNYFMSKVTAALLCRASGLAVPLFGIDHHDKLNRAIENNNSGQVLNLLLVAVANTSTD